MLSVEATLISRPSGRIDRASHATTLARPHTTHRLISEHWLPTSLASPRIDSSHLSYTAPNWIRGVCFHVGVFAFDTLRHSFPSITCTLPVISSSSLL